MVVFCGVLFPSRLDSHAFFGRAAEEWAVSERRVVEVWQGMMERLMEIVQQRPTAKNNKKPMENNKKQPLAVV